MTPQQAAELIGMSQMQVRWLIRAGKLPAKRKPSKKNHLGWQYDIAESDAIAIRDARPKNNPGRGRPRGSIKPPTGSIKG